MLDLKERRILNREYDRLKRNWEKAYDRYCVTGTRRAQAMMRKCDLLMRAIEAYIVKEETKK